MFLYGFFVLFLQFFQQAETFLSENRGKSQIILKFSSEIVQKSFFDKKATKKISWLKLSIFSLFNRLLYDKHLVKFVESLDERGKAVF